MTYELLAQWAETDSCPWVAWQDRSAWSLAIMPLCLWLAPIWAMLCPEGPVHGSAPCPRTSQALLALAQAGWWPRTWSCCWLGHGCSHLECARSWAGTAPGATPACLAWEERSQKLPCYLSMYKITQALQLGAPGCLCIPLELPKKCLQGSGLQAAIS